MLHHMPARPARTAWHKGGNRARSCPAAVQAGADVGAKNEQGRTAAEIVRCVRRGGALPALPKRRVHQTWHSEVGMLCRVSVRRKRCAGQAPGTLCDEELPLRKPRPALPPCRVEPRNPLNQDAELLALLDGAPVPAK